MEVAITKISQNGQVVIPSEVRKDAGVKPSTQFLVFNEDGNILLKQIRKESLKEDMQCYRLKYILLTHVIKDCQAHKYPDKEISKLIDKMRESTYEGIKSLWKDYTGKDW